MDQVSTTMNHANIICIDSDGDCEDSALVISDGEEDVIFVDAISARRLVEEPLPTREDATLDLSSAMATQPDSLDLSAAMATPPDPLDLSNAMATQANPGDCLNLSLADLGLGKCRHDSLTATPDFYSTNLLDVKAAGDSSQMPELSLEPLSATQAPSATERGRGSGVIQCGDLKVPVRCGAGELSILTNTSNDNVASLKTPQSPTPMTFGSALLDSKADTDDDSSPLPAGLALGTSLSEHSTTHHDSTTDCNDSSTDLPSDGDSDDWSIPKRTSPLTSSPPTTCDYSLPSPSPPQIQDDQSQGSTVASWMWSAPSASSSAASAASPNSTSSAASGSLRSRSSKSRSSSPRSPPDTPKSTDHADRTEAKITSPMVASPKDRSTNPTSDDVLAKESEAGKSQTSTQKPGGAETSSSSSTCIAAVKSSTESSSSESETGTDDDDTASVVTPIITTPLVPQATPMFDLLINFPENSSSSTGNYGNSSASAATDFSVEGLLGRRSGKSDGTTKPDSTSPTAAGKASVRSNCDTANPEYPQASSSTGQTTVHWKPLCSPEVSSSSGDATMSSIPSSSTIGGPIPANTSRNLNHVNGDGEKFSRQSRSQAAKFQQVIDKLNIKAIKPKLSLNIVKRSPTAQSPSENAMPPKKRRLHLGLPCSTSDPSTWRNAASTSISQSVGPLPIRPTSLSKSQALPRPSAMATMPQSTPAATSKATSPSSALLVSDSSNTDDDTDGDDDLMVLDGPEDSGDIRRTSFVDKHDECTECEKLVLHRQLLYCCCGKTCCNKCVERKVTNLLSRGEKGLPKCGAADCEDTLDLNKLPEFLPSIVMTILRKKIEEEMIGDIKDWLKPSKEKLDPTSLDRVMELPAYWTPVPDHEDFIQVELDASTQEYIDVHNYFHQTMHNPRAQITSIKRAQNPTLWRFYAMKRHQMIKELMNVIDPSTIEQQLFHGTRKEHSDAICRDNFDWRLCGVHGTAFGMGSYFARDASYSHRYTDKPHYSSVSYGSMPQGVYRHLNATRQSIQQVSASHMSALAFSFMSSIAPPMSLPAPMPLSLPQTLGSGSSSAFLPIPGAGSLQTPSSTSQQLPPPLGLHPPPLPGLLTSKDPLLGQVTTSADRPTHTHVMFLARVLTGRYTLGKASLRKPPPLDGGRHYKSYDSCVNQLRSPYIYVVFEKSQCYPEYLIEYTNQPR